MITHGFAAAPPEEGLPNDRISFVSCFAGPLWSGLFPVTLVTPQTWKNRADLIGKDKDAARTRAIQIWPAWRALDLKGKGQALADAALPKEIPVPDTRTNPWRFPE